MKPSMPHCDRCSEYGHYPSQHQHADDVRDAVWSCKVGWANRADLPSGSDGPMRQAVEIAFYDLTGHDPQFTFSGWGEPLEEKELAVVENRWPDIDVQIKEAEDRLAMLRAWKRSEHSDGRQT